MTLFSPPSAPQQSKAPAYSGLFQMYIKQKGTETRLPRLVYFNHERGFFYAAESSDSEQKFRGPHTGLSVVGVVQNGGVITFPSNKDYEVAETISPVNSGSDEISDRTQSALEVALSAKKPLYLAPSTSPSYYPKTGEAPTLLDK